MRFFDRNASATRFLLGGIGTGNISLDQNARLCDFELFNKPNKGFRNPYNFFAVRTEAKDGTVRTKALESQLSPPFDNSHGNHAWEMGGVPRFRESKMSGDYPFVHYTLSDWSMPIVAEIEAFTPFIPLSTDDSSLPAFVLRYKIKNITDSPLTVSVVGSMSNLSEYDKGDFWTKPLYKKDGINRYVDDGINRGIHYLPAPDRSEEELNYFEMALLTTEKDGVTYLDNWNEGAWWDGIQDFWNDFKEDGELSLGRSLKGHGNTLSTSQILVGSLCIKKEILPAKEAVFEFIISWYHPNRIQAWNQTTACCQACEPEQFHLVRNYYAKFGNALSSAGYLTDNLPRLEALSRSFVDALSSSTLPELVLEAISANITVIRSTTCFRIEDGSFYGWEGCFDFEGCCWGSCTHVWNYTQTLAFLFPELERSMRRTQFLAETKEDGYQAFRAKDFLRFEVRDSYIGAEVSVKPAADGQLGSIVRLYRDWMLCGDDNFLREMWPKAQMALEYAFAHWDCNQDGIIDEEAHNTYDIEFFGTSSMINSIYYAALKAGERICNQLGDVETAQKYARIAKAGGVRIDAECFNGEYYEQKLDNIQDFKYQYGKGCLSDQILGQQLAHVSNLGYILDKEHVARAVHSIYKYNFVEDFGDFDNIQRTFSLNDDTGLVLCSWPHGGRPQIPFIYSDEVWTGIEYQVASHLIYEGYVEEGIKIVEAVRNRHDGVKRNPWNEVECGHHYARSLASYGLLLALTGFNCDAVNKVLRFKPATNQEDFRGFFSCGDGWGIFHQKKLENGEMKYWIETLYGNLDAYTIQVR